MDLQHLAVNRTGVYRKATLNGRAHYVVPVAMIVPGVLNGSKGKLYYPPEEIVKNHDAWNGMPLVVYHPTVNGKPVSARTANVLEKQGVGTVFNSKINSRGKLVAEAWFDVEKTKKVDNRIISRIEQGEQIELSTGLFTDNEPVKNKAEAIFNGKSYEYIAKNYRPDHLAILPDQTGACSLKDGCGVGVLNAKVETEEFADEDTWVEEDEPTDNILSHNEMYPLIEEKLRTQFSGAYINEVYPDHIIFRWGNSLYKLGYEVSEDDAIVLSREVPQAVRRSVSYKPALVTLNGLAKSIIKSKKACGCNECSQGHKCPCDKSSKEKALDVVNSYFKTCKRDPRGKCLPKNGSAAASKEVKTGSKVEKKAPKKTTKKTTEKPPKSIAGEKVTPPTTLKASLSDTIPKRGKPAKAARVGVPADEVPPPPKMQQLPNLTKSERKVEREFMKAYEKDPDGMANKLRRILKKGTKKGDPVTFGTDDAKVLHKAWGNKKLSLEERAVNRATLNTPLHQTANAVTKRAFVQHLNTLKKGDEIMVTVGGCGAGKGYALKNVPTALEMKKRSKAVWDSAGDQNATENKWIQKEAEKRGLKVNYVFVDADPKTQWAHPERGVVKRAQDPNDGRMVDAKVFADSYALGAKNHQAFYQANKKNPNANFIFLQNGSNPQQIPGIPKERLKLNSKQLTSYALETVAKNAEIPPHVRRGATVGVRIWPEGLVANSLVYNAEEPNEMEFDDSEEYQEGLDRLNEMTDYASEEDLQVDTDHTPMELDDNGVELTEDEEPTENSDPLAGLSNTTLAHIIVGNFSDEARAAALEARRHGGKALKAAGKAIGSGAKHALKRTGQAYKEAAMGIIQKLKDRLGIKSKPSKKKPAPQLAKDKTAQQSEAKKKAQDRLVKLKEKVAKNRDKRLAQKKAAEAKSPSKASKPSRTKATSGPRASSKVKATKKSAPKSSNPKTEKMKQKLQKLKASNSEKKKQISAGRASNANSKEKLKLARKINRVNSATRRKEKAWGLE